MFGSEISSVPGDIGGVCYYFEVVLLVLECWVFVSIVHSSWSLLVSAFVFCLLGR